MRTWKTAKRVVIKVGSSTLTYETGNINIRRVEQLVKVLADLKNAGKEIILVSSGAIAVGVGKVGLPERPKDTPTKQAMAAVGQCELMYIYDKLFTQYNHKVAQVLLTRDVVDVPERKAHVQNTFERLLEMGAIPIVNENDTVAVEEIEFGDNDSLSAMVATLTRADPLLILSDIDGLYNKNPREHPDAKRIPVVEQIDETIYAMASGAGSNRGTGGMVTKLHAAQWAGEHGIETVVLNGSRPENLYDVLEGQPVGTRFLAQKSE